MKKILLFLSVALTATSLIACKSKEEKIEYPTTWMSEDIDNSNEELYEQVVGLENRRHPNFNVIGTKYETINFGTGLTWMVMNHEDEPDRKYHVIVNYLFMDDNDVDSTITQEYLDEINKKRNTDFKVDEWVKMTTACGFPYEYYYIFTADELFALANGTKLICKYVGSGEGNVEDIDYKTHEGMELHWEIYGDEAVQYKKENMNKYLK